MRVLRTIFTASLLALLVTTAPALAQESPGPAAGSEPAAAADTSSRIGRVTISPRIGWAYYGKPSFYGSGVSGSGVSHSGMNLQVNFDFGGKGSNFEIAPYYTYHATVGSAMHSMGVYLGWAYRMEFLGGKLYPSIGVGEKIGYLAAKGSDFGLEMTTRIPIGVTYYIMKDFGLVFELGFGYAALLMKGNSFFASNGFYTDGGIGIRWP